MNILEKLDEPMLPPKEAFFSRLKNDGISDEDYAVVWRGATTACATGITTEMWSIFAIHRKTVRLLRGTRHAHVQKRRKRTRSDSDLPVLRSTGKHVLYALRRDEKDLHEAREIRYCRGPFLIFTRYHEKGITKIRQTEYWETARICRSIVGYDANALYLWSMMQYLLTGLYTRRREENEFRPKSAQLHGQMVVEWLS